MSQRIRYSSDLKFYSLDLNSIGRRLLYNLIKNTSLKMFSPRWETLSLLLTCPQSVKHMVERQAWISGRQQRIGVENSRMCSLSIIFVFTVVCWQWTLLSEILSAVGKNVEDVRLGFPFLVTAVEDLFCPTRWNSWSVSRATCLLTPFRFSGPVTTFIVV